MKKKYIATLVAIMLLAGCGTPAPAAPSTTDEPDMEAIIQQSVDEAVQEKVKEYEKEQKKKDEEIAKLKEQLEEVLETLTERERKVLRLRFGLDDGRARTLEEVGKEFKVTRERIRQIEAKALRKLRHPSRSRKLKDYLD